MIQTIAKYYLDLTRYNLAFSILMGLITLSPVVGIVTFSTFGMLVGLICFKYFQNNQYYFYYNLGIRKSKLIVIAWMFNVIVAFVVLLVWCR